jgi:hypothetical protein
MRKRYDPQGEERRRLFQRMEWVFVWAPPIAAVLMAGFGAVAIAWLVAVPGTTFFQRWLVITLVILGLPLLWLFVRRFLRRDP